MAVPQAEANFQATITEWFAVPLRISGFVRRRNRWWLSRSNVVNPVIEIQRFPSGGRKDIIEFRVNWSVFVPAYAQLVHPTRTSSPSVIASPFRATLIGGSGVEPWWEVSESGVRRIANTATVAEPAEMKDALDRVTTRLLRVATIPDVMEIICQVEEERLGARNFQAAGDVMDTLSLLSEA